MAGLVSKLLREHAVPLIADTMNLAVMCRDVHCEASSTNVRDRHWYDRLAVALLSLALFCVSTVSIRRSAELTRSRVT
jgi:hypothetical protein